ncbi:hypothetical protein [Tsukamurella sp. USMM236]|uniref:hypothetical protein n=1 Tax=Tsukamurella sp. USMM236 TaxID=3081301 RepID=UPI00301933D3
MDITQLTRLVPPPIEPAEIVRWDEVEARIGKLPDDYKELISTYGPGTFWGDLTVNGPEWIEESGTQHDLVEILHRIANRGPESVNLSGAPDGRAAVGTESDQYLAWGGASGTQTGFWRVTDADPNKWPVVFTELSAIDYEPAGLVAYLVSLFGGAFDSVALPEDWLEDSRDLGAPPFERG